jgi:hypothetical protein
VNRLSPFVEAEAGDFRDSLSHPTCEQRFTLRPATFENDGEN